jgi:glycosyltransferase involved in cell wall biosynthesis
MVSVIICFYERTKHLFLCLDSLKLNQEFFDEVIISDDGSSIETIDLVKSEIKKYAFKIKFVTRESSGFEVAASRNNGIRNSRGSYLIFIDCDLALLPGSLEPHRKFSQRRKFLIGHCKYLDEKSSLKILSDKKDIPDRLVQLYDQIDGSNLLKLEKRQRKLNLLLSFRLASYKSQALGGHFSLFKEDIIRINGYDEKFKGWGAEDCDLGRRLVKSGCRGVPIQSSAKSLHIWHPRESFSNNWQHASNIKYFNRNNIAYFCKNGIE